MAAEHPILPQFPGHPHTAGTRRGYCYWNTTDGNFYYDNGIVWYCVGTPWTLNVRRWAFTAGQILTMGTQPITIVPAVSGYVLAPVSGVLIKRAGPAFATVTAQAQIKFDNTALTPCMTLTAVGVADQTVESTLYNHSNGQAFVATPADATRVGGKALKLSTNGGTNWTGTGSEMGVLLAYELIPASGATVDQWPASSLP